MLDNDKIDKILVCHDTDLNILSVVSFQLEHNISYETVSPNELNSYLEQQSDETKDDMQTDKTIENEPEFIDDSIIELIDSIISDGIRLRASDIHLEPFEKKMDVRYRIDGVLQSRKTIERSEIPAVISRVKIMSGLDIAEKRRPQDGRIRFEYKTRTIDLRVSVLPTDFGEKIVLRILDKSELNLDLNYLGFEKSDLSLFKSKIKLPNGVILITGPTGSGKTTTLYATLNHIKSPELNITTIEDPIEYNLEGINQTQIKPQINLTFASSLRAILRQDPNIIMVGEIRDNETLENALRAALTGHLVFSTIHTNDAISTITRLVDLGAEEYLLRSALKLIVAQRLVRKICPKCKSQGDNESEKAALKALNVTDYFGFSFGAGCEFCHNTGYSGRTAIYEMLPIDESNSGKVLSDQLTSNSSQLYKELGVFTLRQKGIELIKEGITTPSEVLRETG
ncbi:MAG: GspE/PulE family protein [Candidatus Zixiibacteriota bacterium]